MTSPVPDPVCPPTAKQPTEPSQAQRLMTQMQQAIRKLSDISADEFVTLGQQDPVFRSLVICTISARVILTSALAAEEALLRD